ncbi:unnamed protein product [Xylocopa violacea]|uniref:Uncharacterized protein n=1 Tax=Xylocopa violacea TaxID=135666 RepID=A0ABP1NLX3_XYLVO
MGSERGYEPKKEKSSEELSHSREAAFVSSVLAKSESMPVFKSTSSSRDDNDEEHVSLTSESSLAHTSRADRVDEKIEPKKAESEIELPAFQSTINDSQSCAREVKFYEVPENKGSPKVERRSRSSSREPVKPEQTQGNDDLIDIAENPHPSIRSFYWPPTPDREDSSHHYRQQPRITDVDAIMKIDGELAPLQHQLNEIRGKFRALNLTVPSILSQDRYSAQYMPRSNISGYYLHRTETFGRDSNVSDMSRLIPRQQESRGYHGTGYSYPTYNETAPATQDFFSIKESVSRNASVANKNSFQIMVPRECSSRSVGRNTSNEVANWQIQENDSYVSAKNSFFQFGMHNDPSGSLIPSVSSSCYRYPRNRDYRRPHASSYYNELRAGGSNSTYVKHNGMASTSGRPTRQEYRDISEFRKADKILQAELARESNKLTLDTSTVTSNPQIRLININTSMKDHYTDRMIAGRSTSPREAVMAHEISKKDSDSSFDRPQDQTISASLTVIGSDGSSRTRYVNYTRVDSQASLVLSKKDQSVNTLVPDGIQNDFSSKLTKQKVRELDAESSGPNLTEIVRKSVETLLGASESVEIRKSSPRKDLKSIQVAKTNEKVIIVPILFTDGIPEPPKVPLFNFTRSRCHLPKASHHLVKLDKKSSSATQGSVFSANSVESSTFGSSYTNQKLMNRNSGVSMSCVSRTGSSSRCRTTSHVSNPVNAMSDYHHHHHHHSKHRGRHSHSSKAHSEPTKRVTKKVIHGMRSSPEEFLCDT